MLLTGGSASSQVTHTDPVSVIRDDGSRVRYYLELSDNESHSKTLFLFLQGSDCNSVRHMPVIDIIKSISPDADILTIEKYGITEELPYSMHERDTLPQGYAEHDNPRQRASDAGRVTEALAKEYGYEKMLVLGGSEGATVACMLASECRHVDATITLGGGGRFFIDDVVTSIRATDAPEDEKEKEIEGFGQFAQYILSQDDIAGFSMGGHGFGYWKTMLSTDQQEIISHIDTPMLILQGGKDQSASPEKTTEMVEELKRAGKTNIDYYIYPEYDHSLSFGTDEHARERVIDDIRKWIIRNTRYLQSEPK